MLAQLVTRALQDAYQRASKLSHAQRSAAWVEAFTEQLRDHSCKDALQGNIVAFCRADSGNRPEFRTNELLFDILVAESRAVRAAKGKSLQALSRALWVVESELKRSDSRDVLVDLNKLVIAKSVNKVLVISAGTPLLAWAQEVVSELLDPRESNVFLVTISHPEEWSRLPTLNGVVYRLSTEGQWLEESSG